MTELKAKLGVQERERILADPKVKALRKRFDALRAKRQPLDAEEKSLRKEGTALGLQVSSSEAEFSLKSGYNDPIPEVARKATRVRTFERLDRKLRTAMVGGDRTEIRAALEALIAHVDSE